MWIEINGCADSARSALSSLPLRECGLKLVQLTRLILLGYVTPLAGVWIEILMDITARAQHNVTPLAGVWIEIKMAYLVLLYIPSLPLRECGLKYRQNFDQ